jgi:hypothetical protein
MKRYLALSALVVAACTSVDYVRIPKGSMPLASGEPIAAVSVSRMGFYFFGAPVAECNLEMVLHQLLVDAAHKVGADRVVDVRFEATPESGIWWFFTHVLPFPPTARAWGIAIRNNPAPPAAASPPRPDL